MIVIASTTRKEHTSFRSFFRSVVSSAWLFDGATSDEGFAELGLGTRMSITDQEGSRVYQGYLSKLTTLGSLTHFEIVGPFLQTAHVGAFQVVNCSLETALRRGSRSAPSLVFEIDPTTRASTLSAFYWPGGTLGSFLASICAYYGVYYVSTGADVIEFFSGAPSARSAGEEGRDFSKLELSRELTTNRAVYVTEGLELGISDTVNGSRFSELVIRSQSRDLAEVVLSS